MSDYNRSEQLVAVVLLLVIFGAAVLLPLVGVR
jgi:hypothetical protein